MAIRTMFLQYAEELGNPRGLDNRRDLEDLEDSDEDLFDIWMFETDLSALDSCKGDKFLSGVLRLSSGLRPTFLIQVVSQITTNTKMDAAVVRRRRAFILS